MTDIVIEQPASTPEAATPMIEVLVQEALFLEDCVVVKIGSGAAELEKKISYEDFKAILTQALGRREDEKLEGYHLPSNCFYFAKSSSQIQLSCYYQERVGEIIYGSKKMKIKVPNLIISHVLGRKPGNSLKVESSKYFCTNLPVNKLPQNKFINSVEPNAKIFLSPFSNTYREGNMCYGGNQMPATYTENNLRGLDYYYQFLFSSPFNNDLGINALSQGRDYVGEWYSELEKIAKAEGPFPYERLRGYN